MGLTHGLLNSRAGKFPKSWTRYMYVGCNMMIKWTASINMARTTVPLSGHLSVLQESWKWSLVYRWNKTQGSALTLQ